MSSPAKQTATIRRRKEAKAGRKRKAANRTQGSTKSAAELFGDQES